jgi:hypothetical protein
LVRPRFFCGQLLTDEDLSTMVGWTARKFRLQRFRDGWGVACGLEVRCDPDDPLGVIVGEGYAVSCCGEDIVLCNEEKLNLADAFPTEDPCAVTDAVVSESGSAGPDYGGHSQLTDTQSSVATSLYQRLAEAGKKKSNNTVMAGRWVDVMVAYAEREADPRASMRHGDCVEAPDCEAAKTLEWFKLSWSTGSGEDPAKAAVDEWCRHYERCLDVLRQFVRQFGTTGSDDWRARQQWLLSWIERNAPRMFGDLHDRISAWSKEELNQRLCEVLIRLVLECRRAYTRAPCHTCERTNRVQLARVYLGQVASGSPVRVLSIDNDPPFRRPLSPAAAPAPLGGFNVGFLVGARWVQARQRLAELGVRADARTVAMDVGAAGLLDQLDCKCGPLVEWGEHVVVQVARFAEDPEGYGRVVGFCVSARDVGVVPSKTETPPKAEEPPAKAEEPPAKAEEPPVKADEPPVKADEPPTPETPIHKPPPPKPEPPPPVAPGDAAPTSVPPSDKALRDAEKKRLMQAHGIGDFIADRLLDSGLTLEVIATAPAGQRDAIVDRVENALPVSYKGQAAKFVEALRRIWDHTGSGGR